jgi:cell division protein FtsL
MNMGSLVYGLMFSAILLLFTYYSNRLIVNNITSNENLRQKWNGAKY